MNKTQLANYFDHTFLKAYATEADLTKLCNEAKKSEPPWLRSIQLGLNSVKNN